MEDVDTAMRIVLPLLPDGSAKMPLYCAAYEAVYFAYQWKENGLEHAARESGRRIGKEYLVPTVVNRSWERISRHSPQTPLTGYAEKAYKRTMSQILNRGVDALADYQ